MSRVTRGRVLREKQATAQHYTNIEQVNAENATAVAFLRDETSDKITPAMRQSLVDLQNSLTCPLCASVLVQPVSLPACSHTFCCPCIDRYVENSWTCPIKTCNMPVSMKNTHQGKFRNVNSATQTSVSSWSKICHTLMRAEDGWWRDQGDDVMNSDDNNDSAMDRPKDTQETYATAEEDDDEVYSV